MSPGETRELADIFHINESPPPVLVEQFCLGELPRTTFKASWESFLFQPEKYSLNFHLFLPTKAHVFLTSHHTQFAPYSTGQCFPPPLQFHWHKICHLVKKLEGYGPIWGAGANPFIRRDSLLWGIFSKSADLAAWAWCDWCRHLSPGVTVIAISVTVSAGFPLHYLKELWMSETVGL